MFTWYSLASVCFAYLEDVLWDTDLGAVEFQLARSRWFTRGWTLQELLAPEKLIFFSREWIELEDRAVLAMRIGEITGIDERFLTDQNCYARVFTLSTASIAERMSWAAKRTTTKPEDMAYCLLGIFGVNMPLIYGEDGKAAFLRLQEEIIRRCFDPTILAWNTTAYDRATGTFDLNPPSRPAAASFWWSAAEFLIQRNYPWKSQGDAQQRIVAVPSMLLADGPKWFQDCGDIVPSEVDLDWDLTVSRLSVELPRSEDEHPYVVLPCRLKDDPCHLLALPLYHRGDGLYARCTYPAMWVSHQTWHRWPQRRTHLLLQPFDQAHILRMPYQSFWLRSMPPEYRLLQVYPSEGWSPSTKSIWPIRRASRPGYKDTASIALLIERKHDRSRFAILLDVREANVSYLPRILPLWAGSHFVPCHREEEFREIVESHLDTAWRAMYVEGPRGVTNVATEKILLHDKTIFSIDIRQTPHGFSTHLLKFIYCMVAWLLGCLEARSAAYPTLFFIAGSVGDLILIFLSSLIMAVALDMLCDRVLIRFLDPWFAKTLTLVEVSTVLGYGCQLLCCIYRYLPIVSYFAPTSTSWIRRHRARTSLVTTIAVLAFKSPDPDSIAYVVFSTGFYALVTCSHIFDNNTAPQLPWADELTYCVALFISVRVPWEFLLYSTSPSTVTVIAYSVVLPLVWGVARIYYIPPIG